MRVLLSAKPAIYVLTAAILSAAISFLASWYLIGPYNRSNRAETIEHSSQVGECINRTLQVIKPQTISASLFERVWRLCGNEAFNALYLEDFRIRKEKFVRQYLDERVTLWMVVAITLSGVLLAAVQLVMSFRLALRGRAAFGQDNELALESGKISLRSSITGAVILALSFAFFMVYVIWIYSIREVTVARPDNLQEVSVDNERSMPLSRGRSVENAPTPVPKTTNDSTPGGTANPP